MSRSIRFTEFGGPEVLKVVDERVPEPGEGQVRLVVKAFALNRAEAMWRAGNYVETASFPARIGYEAAGVIDAVGRGTTGFAAGDVVNVLPNFSMNEYGMHGDVVLAPISAIIRQPKSLTFEEAASLWLVYITAFGALIEKAKLEAGDFVLIPAASSSVGLAAIQVANWVGAVPIALTRSSAKREQLLKAGAKFVVATEEEDLVTEVLKITDGVGARVVFDPVGGPTLVKLVKALKKDGIILLYGALSEEATTLPMLDLLIKSPTIVVYVLWETTTDPRRLRVATDFILRGVETGNFKPLIDRSFPLERIADAHRYLESNNQFGKVVLVP